MSSSAPLLTPSVVSTKHYTHPTLETIFLRPLKGEDAAVLYQAVDKNREYLSPWLPWVAHQCGPADSFAFLLSLDYQPFSGTGVSFGLFSQDTLIGSVGLHGQSNVPKGTELGYWIDQEFTGQGLTTWAAGTIINDFQSYQQACHYWMRIVPDNLASLKIAQKLGFQYQETLHNVSCHGASCPTILLWKKYLRADPGPFTKEMKPQ